MSRVELRCVHKKTDHQIILQGVTLSIEKGEFVVVIGPSGSGKSTLLRLIAGLETVSEGEILLKDVPIHTIPPADRDIAMVFQDYALYPHMTVYQNMAYGLKRRGFAKSIIDERIKEVVQWLGLDDCLTRKPNTLSGGQRQRVAIGRAMVRRPSLFLFDEPLSNLDVVLKTQMRHEIKRIHRHFQSTCLYVTHDQTEAMSLADKIVVLRLGRIEQIGSPRTLYDYPASQFVANFLGNHPMNFIPARNKGDTLELSIGITLPMPLLEHEMNEEEMLIGVRAEHISMVSIKTEESFDVMITNVDDLGAEILVSANCLQDNTAVVARLTPVSFAKEGIVSMQIELKHALVFSKKSGQRIGKWV